MPVLDIVNEKGIITSGNSALSDILQPYADLISIAPFMLIFFILGYYLAQVLPLSVVKHKISQKIITFFWKKPIINALIIGVPILLFIVIMLILFFVPDITNRVGTDLVFYTFSTIYGFFFEMKKVIKEQEENKISMASHIVLILIVSLNFTLLYFKHRDATEEEIQACRVKFDATEDEPVPQIKNLFANLCVKDTPKKRFTITIH